MRLFSDTGSVVTDDLEDYGIVWMCDADDNPTDFGRHGEAFMLGRMPLTEISISKQTDMACIRTLGNDFAISVFGQAPVSITLKGISIIKRNECAESVDDGSVSTNGYLSVDDFYDDLCVDYDPDKRILLYLDTGVDIRQFKCVLTGMETSGGTSSAPCLYTTYALSMVGVEI